MDDLRATPRLQSPGYWGLGLLALAATLAIVVIAFQTWRVRTTITEIKGHGGTVEWNSPEWMPTWIEEHPLPWFVTYRHVRLSYTPVDDDAFRRYAAVFDGFADVERLGLSSTRLSESTLRDLSNLPSLTQLELDDTRTSDDVLEHVAQIVTLEELSITNTDVTDAGVEHLRHLPHLAILSLDGTLVGDASAESLAGIRTLEVISLSNTRMTEDGVTVLQSRFPLLDLTDD